MKRIFAIILAALLMLSLTLIPAGAAENYIVKLDDGADLLTADEEAALTATMQEVSDACQCNVLFITAADLSGATFTFNGTADDYAFRYYETTCGVNVDGLLVFLTLSDQDGDRSIGVFGTGKCERRLTDEESEDIRSDAISYHNPNYHGYYDFFNAIALGLKEAVPPHLKWYSLPLALIIGFVIALLIMLRQRSKLKSVKMNNSAAQYVRSGSMHVSQSRDTYLYSSVSRTAKPKDSGSSGGHSSSGGGSYSGGSSKF